MRECSVRSQRGNYMSYTGQQIGDDGNESRCAETTAAVPCGSAGPRAAGGRSHTPARRRRRGVVGFRKGSVSDQRVATHVLFGSSRADVSTSSFGSLPRLASNAVISFQTRIRSWTTVADQQCRVLGSLTTHSFCSSDLPRGAVGAVTAKKVCRLNNVASPR